MQHNEAEQEWQWAQNQNVKKPLIKHTELSQLDHLSLRCLEQSATKEVDHQSLKQPWEAEEQTSPGQVTEIPQEFKLTPSQEQLETK